MAIHNLTTAQVQKFVDAFGGDPEWKVVGGQFTTQQLKSLVELIDGLHDWPKITDDPQVNSAVNCVTLDDDKEPTYHDMYTDEGEDEAARDSGMLD